LYDLRVPKREIFTVPNLITLLRLCCLPLFLWLLFTVKDRGAAAWLLGGLGATDWVDGWVARRFNQQSDFGAIFDPSVDRGLFIVAVIAILIDQSMPIWFGGAILAREVFVASVMAIATAFGMKRFAVNKWGKRYTFLLMFAVPLILLGQAEGAGSQWVTGLGWLFGVPALVMSYTTAFNYMPLIMTNLRLGRASGSG
jgi:cardiolipin synthase (CMP-forming)